MVVLTFTVPPLAVMFPVALATLESSLSIPPPVAVSRPVLVFPPEPFRNSV